MLDPAVARQLVRHRQRVNAIVDRHRQEMNALREYNGAVNAIYCTEFWPWYDGWGKRTYGGKWGFRRNGTETEDNRLQREVQTYNAALFLRSLRCNVKRDPQGRGDPAVKSACLNQYWEQPGQATIVRDVSEMAILFHGGAALKVGVDEGTGSPLERAYIEAVPPWELVIDRDAPSIKRRRYVGHMYQRPKEEVEAQYGVQLAERSAKLVGSRRLDYLETSTTTPIAPTQTQDQGGESGNPEDEYVTVLELCNLVDSVECDGTTYRGRLEIWILDQNESVSSTPIAITPLPFAGADGQASPHLFVLDYMHRPGRPNRPHAPVARLVPLQIGLNRLQSQAFRDIQRNTRKALARKSRFEQDQWDNLRDGSDENVALVKDDEQPLSDAFYAIPHQPLAADTVALINQLDGKLTRSLGPSQNARGEITGATAHEVQTTQLFTEEGLKYHSLLLTGLLEQVSACLVRAFIVGSVDTSDAVGGETLPTDGLAPVGSVDEAHVLPSTGGTSVNQQLLAASIPPKGWAEYPVEDNGETYTVTRESLDGNTVVVFTQAERTPVTDAALMAWLMGAGGQQYFALLDLVVAGGYKGVMARLMMEEIAIRAQLPKSLHPAALLAKIKEEGGDTPPPPPPAQGAHEGAEPPPKGEPPGGAPKPPSSGDGRTTLAINILARAGTALYALVKRRPDLKSPLGNAIMGIRQSVSALESGDIDGAQQGVLAASQALSAITDVEEPELDAARKDVAQVAKAATGGQLTPQPIDVAPGAPDQPPGEEPNAAV